MKAGTGLLIVLFFVVPGCSDPAKTPDMATDDAGPDARGYESTSAQCKDGKDNDGDGYIDCKDQDCQGFKFCGKPDGGPKDGPADKTAKDTATTDIPVGDTLVTTDSSSVPDQQPSDLGAASPLPGCPAGCPGSQVCLGKGKCGTPGPAATCGKDRYGPKIAKATPGVIFVDAAHKGKSTGTWSQPYKTIADALALGSLAKDTIAVAAGTYHERLLLDRTVTLQCRCPKLVTITGGVVVKSKGLLSSVSIGGCRLSPQGFGKNPADWGRCHENPGKDLTDVWGASGSSVYAVGNHGTILHLDGGRWTSSKAVTANALNGVWGSTATSLCAVGANGTVVFHDGKKWTAMSSLTKATLLDVWGSTPSDIYAVGDNGTILHFDGKTWSPMASKTLKRLNGVWGTSSSNVFATGDKGTLLHFDGKTWKSIIGSTTNINAMWGTSSGKAWFMVGKGGTILFFDGSKEAPMASGTKEDLYAVWGNSSSEVFAVGANGTVLRYDGKVWKAFGVGTTKTLRGVWGSSATDVFVVGDTGAAFRYDGSAWRPMSSEDPAGIDVNSGGKQVNLLVSDSELTGWCSGVYMNALSSSSSSLCVSRTRLYANVKGIDVQNSPTSNPTPNPECKGLQQGVALKLTRIDHNRKYGIFFREGAQGIAMEASMVEATGRIGTKVGGGQEEGFGVLLGNVDSALMRQNVIRMNENRGVGMINQTSLKANVIKLEANAIVSNRGAGIALQQLQTLKVVQIKDNLISGTGIVNGEPGGDGIQISLDKGKQYSVTVSNNTVETSKRHGVFYDGIAGSVDGNTVRKNGGYGVVLQKSSASVGKKNVYTGNAKGNVNAKSVGEKYGCLPIPTP